MKLSKIKISGFKSFVDPTVIAIPSHLVAVVGPNGCGKSNVIDAVTWVMGESSPKYLRGESSTDVIFNGSSARKPVGQASVELIFDNSDATIGGEFASYSEISIKRTINRDSDSVYFLNGARCRKRDVVDLFLGTGLGPRSYSIVGQNMVSRIVEAKPEDLRTYLEEAAGISKYKERRHETELRIKHTKENLARVFDLLSELEKQLSNLKHQANVAEKYKTLKQEERTLRSELYGVQWRNLDTKIVDYTLQIQREETSLEARQSELISTDKENEDMRHEQRVAQDGFQEIQRRYYAAGNEITRLEQDILHFQEKQTQWQNDLKQIESDWGNVKNQITETEDQLQELEQDIHNIEPQLMNAAKEVEALELELEDAEEEVQSCQTRWDEFNQAASKTAQTAQVEKTHIQHLEQRIDSLQQRQEKLQQDQGQFNFVELDQEIKDFATKSSEMMDKLELQNQELTDVRGEITTLQSEQLAANNKLDQVRSESQRLRGQQASLEALQQTALGQRDNAVSPWVTKHNLAGKPRLAQNIQVDQGWELAVEKALGFTLQAICLEQVDDVVAHLDEFKNGNLCVFTSGRSQAAASAGNKGTLLLEKIKCPWALDSLLSGIYVADTMDAALALCESLAADESVMTRDGVWLNRSWLKILRQDDPAAGVFQREEELKQLAARIEVLQETQQELEDGITDRREQIQALELERDQLQQAVSQCQAQAAQISTQQKMKQERLVELKSQSERGMRELEECTAQLAKAQAELVQARSVWEQALTDSENHESAREELIQERDAVRQRLQFTRENVNRKREKMHENEIRLQTSKSQKGSHQQAITRLQQQLTSLTERKISLQSELTTLPALDGLKQTLNQSLDKHVGIEAELNKARGAVDALEQEARNVDQKRQTIDREINKVRSSLETLRVQLQGWKVKSDTICEQIKEADMDLETILQALPENIVAGEWQSKLDQVVQRISRLGAINLVAIEEYATCLERKEYLDKQVADLNEGMQTLEEAIAKIDKETKMKFKDTFDKVNARFQELFPTVFGGGKAYLELTSDDLLEAGVTTMACPPGKRNSSIYLLSGGEKSLTGVALIFSIFSLNPAPFCMLDEVDAALDDANVLRFTRLVKAMATNTQFIFISHNKITIEMGEHLIGVTMNEPGVSRLVTVDIDKAITLAAS